MYLWNPLAILSCVAGTSSGLENLLLLIGVLGGVQGNIPLASFGIAAGAYVGMHPLLLTVWGKMHGGVGHLYAFTPCLRWLHMGLIAWFTVYRLGRNGCSIATHFKSTAR
jgi:hypothetical protein